MNMTDEIIKAALLGTDKYLPQTPLELESLYCQINSLDTDKDDKFYKMAAASFLYEKCGKTPILLEKDFPKCNEEQAPIVNQSIANALKAFIQNNDDVLLNYLIYQIKINNCVLHPVVIPMMLDKALADKKINRADMEAICGETGRWLCLINENWKGLLSEKNDNQDIWETGTFEQRKEFLLQLRKENPLAAIALLSKNIAEENVVNRVELIQILQENLSLEDEQFLTSCLNDKSQKVKNIAFHFLKIMEGSTINQMFLDYALRALTLKEERFMLISKKERLVINPDATPPEALFALGIDKISSQKEIADHVYWIAQIVEYVNPSALAGKLNRSDEELFNRLVESSDKAILLPKFILATIRFKNQNWAKFLIKDNRQIELLTIIDKNEQSKFFEYFIDNQTGALVNFLLEGSYEVLEEKIAIQLLQALKNSPYIIHQSTYQKLALYLPEEIIPWLLTCIYSADISESQARYFNNQAIEMQRIMEIKNSLKFE
jgi:hypothetical protein